MRKLTINLKIMFVVCCIISLGFVSFLFVAMPHEPEALETATLIILPNLQGPVGSIIDITVKQYTGGQWVTRGVISSSGGSVSVYAEQNTRFICEVSLAHDYAATEAQAKTYTQVFFSITGQFADESMTAGDVTEIPDVVWYIEYGYDWTTAGYPVADTTYTLTFEYQAYY